MPVAATNAFFFLLVHKGLPHRPPSQSRCDITAPHISLGVSSKLAAALSGQLLSLQLCLEAPIGLNQAPCLELKILWQPLFLYVLPYHLLQRNSHLVRPRVSSRDTAAAFVSGGSEQAQRAGASIGSAGLGQMSLPLVRGSMENTSPFSYMHPSVLLFQMQ